MMSRRRGRERAIVGERQRENKWNNVKLSLALYGKLKSHNTQKKSILLPSRHHRRRSHHSIFGTVAQSFNDEFVFRTKASYWISRLFILLGCFICASPWIGNIILLLIFRCNAQIDERWCGERHIITSFSSVAVAVVGCVWNKIHYRRANNRIENWSFSHFTSLVNKFRTKQQQRAAVTPPKNV